MVVLHFLHQPKTGGNTLLKIFTELYGESAVYAKFDNAYSVKEQLATDYLSLTPAERGKIQVLSGHVQFGLGELLPEKPQYVTLFRDPVDRIVSAYYFMKSHPDQHWHRTIHEDRHTLTSFIRFGKVPELKNFVTRMISGMGPGPVMACHLEQARENLGKFAAVGLTEQFNASLVVFKHRLTWDHIPLVANENVTLSRPKIAELSETELETIREYNELDLMLHADVARMFQRQIEDCGPGFAAELAGLERNLAYIRQASILKDEAEDRVRQIEATASWRLTRPVARFMQASKRLIRI